MRQQAATVALPQPAQPLAPRVVDVLTGLPDARWLDRLMRGRAWIALIALALIGLVFMQVSMLGMNAGIGQKVERAAALERSIAEQRKEVSTLSSPERIQREASAMGMIQPKPGDVSFLRSRGSNADGAAAAKTMTEPNAQAAAGAAVAGTESTAAETGGLPPTDAALQAQQQEANAAATVPGAATIDPNAQATPQTATEQTQAQAQPQTQAQPQAQTEAVTPQAQTQQTQQTPPPATAQTGVQPQATGATAAPGTGQ